MDRPLGQKKMAVVGRWPLAQVRLYLEPSLEQLESQATMAAKVTKTSFKNML